MIDDKAVIHASASIGNNVCIGPFSVIGANVEIGDNTWVGPHVVINGSTTIGKENKIFQFSSLGDDPQDKKYAGESTKLVIGNRNTIREYCTFNRGTIQDRGITTVGDDNWVMAYAHIAHDCLVGNNIVMANNAQLAGHVEVGDHVILGAFTAVHQFVKIGVHSFTGLGTILTKDLPPFVMANGNTASAHGMNFEGMKRKGFSDDAIKKLRKAYKIVYRSNYTLQEAIKQLSELAEEIPAIKTFQAFLMNTQRGIVR